MLHSLTEPINKQGGKNCPLSKKNLKKMQLTSVHLHLHNLSLYSSLIPSSNSDVRAPQGAVVAVSQFHLVFIVSLIHNK